MTESEKKQEEGAPAPWSLPFALEPRTSLTYDQLNALMAPLNGNRVASRSQGGRQLSYLEAWDVKAALIRVFGFGGFSADVVEDEIVSINRETRTNNGQEYERIEVAAKVRLRLHIPALMCSYTETAVASQVGRDVGEVADFAVKTAASDALKRCAINLGSQFGLGLYNSGSLADPVRVLLEPAQRKVMVDGQAVANKEPEKKDPVAEAVAAVEQAGGEVVPNEEGA